MRSLAEHRAWGSAQRQHTAEGHQGTRKLLNPHARSAGTPEQRPRGTKSRRAPLDFMACPQRQSFVPPRSSSPVCKGQPLAVLPSPAALGWTCVKNIKGCFAWRRPEDPGHGEQQHQACAADAVAAPAARVPVLALQRSLSTHHHPRSSPDQQHATRGTW